MLGSILLGEKSSISPLLQSKSTTVSDHETCKHQGRDGKTDSQSFLQALKLVPHADNLAKVLKPFKSYGEGIVHMPANITDMEFTMVEHDNDKSTQGTVGYGRVSGESVDRLLADLKKRSLRVSTIKQRLDKKLTYRAIHEDMNS